MVFPGLATARTLVHKCCLGNRCRLHGREGSWSCVGYYLLGHLKGLGDLQIETEMKPHLSRSKDCKCYRPHRKPWKGTFFFSPYQLVQYNGDETKNKAKTKLGRLMLPIFFKLLADENKLNSINCKFWIQKACFFLHKNIGVWW